MYNEPDKYNHLSSENILAHSVTEKTPFPKLKENSFIFFNFSLMLTIAVILTML